MHLRAVNIPLVWQNILLTDPDIILRELYHLYINVFMANGNITDTFHKSRFQITQLWKYTE